MNREQYQNAFSRLEPSQALLDAVLTGKESRRSRSTVRMGNVVLAAVLVMAVLAGTVFAAAHFGWFSLRDAEGVVQPTHDAEAAGKDEQLPPAPENLLRLDATSAENYIGFTLPDAYLEGEDTQNSWKLDSGLYRRYYRNPDPSDPGSPLLTIEIVYDAAYLTRYAAEVVKEEELLGMQTVWLHLSSAADGREQYCLFQRNTALGCYAIISSTDSFAIAEQAAMDVRYEDSGIPLAQTEDAVYYGFRLGWTPEDMTLDGRSVMADRWYLKNATLRDAQLDLHEILLGSSWVSQDGVTCRIGISLVDGLTDIAPVTNGTVYKTGTIGGQSVRWVQGYGGGTFIQMCFQTQQVQLLATVSCYAADPATGTVEEIPADARYVAVAEQILESAELITVAIAEPAPQDFNPFAVG